MKGKSKVAGVRTCWQVAIDEAGLHSCRFYFLFLYHLDQVNCVYNRPLIPRSRQLMLLNTTMSSWSPQHVCRADNYSLRCPAKRSELDGKASNLNYVDNKSGRIIEVDEGIC